MIKNIFQVVAIALVLMIGAVAQGQTAQERARITQNVLASVQRDYASAQQLYASGQRIGNTVSMQLGQFQMNLAQSFAARLNWGLQNPQSLADNGVWLEFNKASVEYQYRQETMDTRPAAQIQEQLHQYAALLNWRNNTAEGRASQKAQAAQLTAAHNQRMANQRAMFDSHQAKMANQQAQFQSYNNNWQAQQSQSDWRQEQFVNGVIYERSPFVNPNGGGVQWVPNEVENPVVPNNDGTFTPLQPYHNY